MIPVVLALAAIGGLAGTSLGATVGGLLWFKQTQDVGAKEIVTADLENEIEVLKKAIDQKAVRDQAKAAGVDVDAALEGYRAAKQDNIDMHQLISRILNGEIPVPISGESVQLPLSLPSQRVEPTREIRAWARKSGHKIADRGRIPRSISDAYHAAHPDE